MKNKQVWINQLKGVCICLVVIYHSVITFYPHLSAPGNELQLWLTKAWIYFNLYLAPFRMPVFFFISGYLIRRYITGETWKACLNKRVIGIAYVLILWGILQWIGLRLLNHWLAPERDISAISNAAYASSPGEFFTAMLSASTSLWYLYALILYFTLCKALHRYRVPLLVGLACVSTVINFIPTPWWGLNSVIRNAIYYALGAYVGAGLLDWLKLQSLRRLAPLALLLPVVVPLWFYNVPLFISLLSVLVIIKLFCLFEERYAGHESALISAVGANTIAIYATHRIVIEGMSLFLLAQIHQRELSTHGVTLLLVFYPFISLILCTLLGLAVRKFSRFFGNDPLFSPPRALTLRPATQ